MTARGVSKACRVWERQRLIGLGGEEWPKYGAAVAQGSPNRLTFTEGRLPFDFVEVTTRTGSQAVRRPCSWPMILALTLGSFPVKRKGQEKPQP